MRAGRYEADTNSKKHGKLKIIIILIVVLALLIAAAIVYSYKTALDSLSVQFTDKALSVEFGGDYPAMDYVSSSEGDVTPAAEFLDADSTGEKSMVYTVTKPVLGGLLDPSREFTLNYTVVDTTEPLVLWSGDGTVLERGSEFDIKKVIAYGDNADPVPSVKVDGKVNMNRNGNYPLHVTVTDASGNSTDWDLTVAVADSVPVYSDDSPRTRFGDFVSAYKGDGRSFGIDVSNWQGDIDFNKVKAAGCEFVVIRCGYSVDGEVTADERFEKNLKAARKAGLKVGLYLYSYDNTPEEVRSAADWIITKLDGETLDLPVVFDWEDFGNFQAYEMNFAVLNDLYDAFSDELAGSGYDSMLYGSKNYLEKVWEKTEKRPVWLAHYTDKTDYKGPYVMWQASCTGRIDGIDGDVDLDIMFN